MAALRLSDNDISVIKDCFLKYFSKDDHLWIFGSRIDETKRGGDIDLYIEVSTFDFDKVYRARSNFWIDLQDQLGEQKIDIVIRDPHKNLEIYQEARSSGIKLV